ncbi:TPA: hypothetical protein PSJ50_002811 [Staphylococcus aureus]|nr:hypothetical protein [Staphylococcus aureus]HDK4166886.1 hypothetical protein [Staphylococcus aureus]
MNDKVTYENLENLSNETEKDKSKLQATPRVRRSAELENADEAKGEEANTKILNGKDKNNIYARGFYDKNENGYIFQFTDKASDFVETKINFKLMMLVNLDGARKQGKYDLHLGIGDKNYNAGKVNITYTKNAIKENVAADEYNGDKLDGTNKHTGIYNINELGKSIKNAQVKLQPYIKASDRKNVVTQFKKGVTKFTVYKVMGK